MYLRVTVATVALFLLAAATSAAITIRVPADQPTIQAGINTAMPGDTVLVGVGVYSWSNGEPIPVVINKSLALIGDGDSSSVILDGEFLYQVLVVSDSLEDVRIAGITLRNAKPQLWDGGGLIISTASHVDLSHVQIEGCEAGYGAGLFAHTDASITIHDCLFVRNHRCDKGAGIYLNQVSSATIQRCEFIGDSANWGGGIYVDRGTDSILIEDCTFEKCRGPHGGGVCVVSDAPVAIRSCRFVECSAIFGDRYGGGAIDCEGSSPSITNNLINLCSGAEAGGIRLLGSSAEVINNTIVSSIGPAIGFVNGELPMLYNNILVGSQSWGVLNYASETSLHISHSCVWDNDLGDFMGNVTADSGMVFGSPLFCDSTTGDFSLSLGSPCLGAGTLGSDIGAFGMGCGFPAVDSIAVDTVGDDFHVLDHTPKIQFRFLDTALLLLDSTQVEVSNDNDWVMAEMWSSGWVVSPDTFLLYAGEPLSDGGTYWLRLRIATATGWSAWEYAQFRLNTPPPTPIPVLPLPASVVSLNPPSLSAKVASDAEADLQQVQFELHTGDPVTYLDSPLLPASPANSGDTVVWTPGLEENRMYFWTARSWDGFEWGAWGLTDSFWVDAIHEPPTASSIHSPGSDSIIYGQHPQYHWSHSYDSDPYDPVSYDHRVAIDSSFAFAQMTDGLTDTAHVQAISLETGRRYWWKVLARDNHGLSTSSTVETFRTYKPGDANGTWSVSSADIITLVNYVFKGQVLAVPECAARCNGDAVVNSSDIIYLVNFVFKGGAEPLPGCL